MEEAYIKFLRTSFGINLSDYNIETIEILKSYISYQRKLINTSERKKFLINCRKHKVIPTFIHLKCKRLFKDLIKQDPKITPAVIKTRSKLMKDYLNFEIKSCINKLSRVKNHCKTESDIIKTNLHVSDTQRYFFSLSFYLRKQFITVKNRLNNKFNALNINYTPIESQFEKNSFHNLTHIDIPDEVKTILSLGPKFAPPQKNKKCPAIKIISEVEDIFSSYSNKTQIQEDRTIIAKSINNHIKTHTQFNDIEKYLYTAFKHTQNFIREHTDIHIINSDKSNKTVIMTKSDYTRKLNTLLEDTNTYQMTIINPTTKINNQCIKKVINLYNKKFIPFTDISKLVTRNPITPRIYGLPKLHKQNIPLRPIVSTINSPVYKLSKYLIQSLKYLTDNSTYNIKNSFQLKSILDTVTLKPDDILVSFDVVSLFTNIPVDMALTEISKRWEELENNTDIKDKNTFIETLQFCVKDNNFFSYNSLIYKQIKGLAMGNPLSPILADIVLEHIFDSALKNINYKPTFIFKYVDDILIAIPEKYINQLHIELEKIDNNIKFTIEKENSNKINYLDMSIFRTTNNKIISCWYSKPTASNRILNYHSQHPKQMKINIINSFIKKVFTLSHSYFKQQNINTITQILEQNNYPLYLIKSIIYKHTNINSNNTVSTLTQNTTLTNNYTFKSLSFIPTLTNKIIKTIKNKDKNKHLIIANKIPFKSNTLFSKLKDPIDKLKTENVVYCIPCDGVERDNEEKVTCNLKYYGNTKHPLEKRLKQHMYNEKNKDRNPTVSGLVDHCHKSRHKMDYKNTLILEQEKNRNKRFTLESSHIWLNSNDAVNFRSDLQNVNKIYTNLFNTIKHNNTNTIQHANT